MGVNSSVFLDALDCYGIVPRVGNLRNVFLSLKRGYQRLQLV